MWSFTLLSIDTHRGLLKALEREDSATQEWAVATWTAVQSQSQAPLYFEFHVKLETFSPLLYKLDKVVT